MLFVLSLDWHRFSISEQMIEANKFMSGMTEKLGVSPRIIFNFASLGAGEKLLPFASQNNAMPEDDTLDYLRWHHHQIVGILRQDEPFKANRDLSEMLKILKGEGHQLAAVFPSRTCQLEELLERARTRDYFEDKVYGYDRRSDDLLANFTLASLYTTAINGADTDFSDSLVVADTPEAICDAVPIHPLAVVGYIDPYVSWDKQGVRLKEMEQAGAHYTAVGGHNVTALPWYLSGRAKREAENDLARIMGRPFH